MSNRIERFGSYGNIGEELACTKLEMSLEKQGHNDAIVLVNARIPVRDDLQREADLILIYKYGIVVVEVKNWRGPVDFNVQHGCLNGRHQQHDPREQALACKNSLMQFLSRKGVSAAVNCMVWFMSDVVRFKFDSNYSAPVFKLSRGAEFLANGNVADWQYSHNRAPGMQLQAVRIEQIAQLLCGIRRDDYIKTIRNYMLLREIGGPLHAEFSASHIGAQADLSIPRIRLKRHRLKPIDTETKLAQWEEHRKQSERAAYRLYDVLDRLDKIPGIPSVRDCFPDPDDDTIIWTAYKYVDGPSLYDACEGKPLTTILRLFVSIASTLQACHEHGVIHRALTQKCITVTRHEPSVPIILGFDFARIESKDPEQPILTIQGEIYEAVYRSNYAAPEVRANVSDASPRSDIYSLGIIFLETLSRMSLSSLDFSRAGIALQELRRKGIPSEIVQLLNSMIQAESSLRPASMSAINKLLEPHLS